MPTALAVMAVLACIYLYLQTRMLRNRIYRLEHRVFTGEMIQDRHDAEVKDLEDKAIKDSKDIKRS